MKKIMIVSVAIVFALTLGVAYAGDMDMSKWDNGITIISAGPVSTGISFFRSDSEYTSAALSHPDLVLDNGVTLVASSPISTGVNYKGGEVISGEEGMAAGGYAGEDAVLHNGITDFDRGPVEAN